MWCIDHGITFHAEDKLRTVIWDYQGQPVPSSLIEDVCRLGERLDGDAEFAASLGALLSEREVAAFAHRIELIGRQGRFPLPPAYRPYPWPMI
jgi:uncharacterized repeat protein (TIGR03843 family)